MKSDQEKDKISFHERVDYINIKQLNIYKISQ